uniref:DDE-1 domain-containing protein n=1 Tax=Trichuris muris TaxID=70415 RepID=A0A5S6QLC3_TRIMR
MEAEMQSLRDHNVWTLEELPKGTKPIKYKWVFQRKTNAAGEVKDRAPAKRVRIADAHRDRVAQAIDGTPTPGGTAKNPRSFKSVKSLPVAYDHQKKAWMNFHLVEDWMKKVFVSEVKRYQEAIGKTGKVLLLIDNAPAHPVIDLLNSVDELVTVKFFPRNVTSLILPMDEGVIRSFKGLYRKNLLRELLMKYDNTAESVTAFYKRISLRDCCDMAAASWESVKQTTLRNSWNKVLGKSTSGADGGRDDSVEIEEIARMLRIMSICGECESSEVERWLGCDSEDQNFQMMNDEEIVESPTRRKTKKSMERRKLDRRLSLRIMLPFNT